MSNKVAIIVAPNGARKQKTDHKSIPISIQEIVDDVKECRKAGAIMAHVHARNSEGQHSLEIDDNLKLLEALESKLGDSIIIQLTTEAIERYTPSQQMQLIREVKPPAASFALRELLPSPTVSSQTIDFFHWVAEQNILAQYILYNQEDVERYSKLCRSNMLPKKGRHALFVLGSYRNNSINYPKDLLPFLYDEFITTEHWGACAFGENEFNCLSAVMLLGGDIRVGFENNHCTSSGNLALSNATQVEYIVKRACKSGVSLYGANEYKRCLMRIEGESS